MLLVRSFVRDEMDVCANDALLWQYVQVKAVSFRTKFVALTHSAAAKVNSALPLVGLGSMAYPVVEFSRQGYKIRKVFG
jgi:hypothetical protein